MKFLSANKQKLKDKFPYSFPLAESIFELVKEVEPDASMGFTRMSHNEIAINVGRRVRNFVFLRLAKKHVNLYLMFAGSGIEADFNQCELFQCNPESQRVIIKTPPDDADRQVLLHLIKRAWEMNRP